MDDVIVLRLSLDQLELLSYALDLAFCDDDAPIYDDETGRARVEQLKRTLAQAA